MYLSSYLYGHGLAAAAPGHYQVALGAKKLTQVRAPGSQGARHFSRPKRHLAMAWQAMAKYVTGNAHQISGNAICGGVGWGLGGRRQTLGWGGVVCLVGYGFGFGIF
jgi:hypothetical protein